jgi:hypothetical protein
MRIQWNSDGHINQELFTPQSGKPMVYLTFTSIAESSTNISTFSDVHVIFYSSTINIMKLSVLKIALVVLSSYINLAVY